VFFALVAVLGAGVVVVVANVPPESRNARRIQTGVPPERNARRIQTGVPPERNARRIQTGLPPERNARRSQTGVPPERNAVEIQTPQGSTAASTTATGHSNLLRLHYRTTIIGAISPKSVVSTQTGYFFAQNMMYRHTTTVYNRRHNLVKTISDAVRLPKFGHPRYPGVSRGAPVEATATPNRRQVYVSNYSMYGPSWHHPGQDTCSPSSGYDRGFVYRIGLKHLHINQAIRVGSVPKYLEVTPDGKYLLVSNWCSYRLSVVNVAKAKEVRSIYLGPYPRGIAVDPDSRYAYVAVMGSYDIARVGLRHFQVTWIRGVGQSPRHLVISPNGKYLYATLNGEGAVAKISLETRKVVAKVHTGSQPRSMAIAPDGLSLYLVNYDSATVSKIGTPHMRVLQTVHTNSHPIGITHDDATGEVWVSCYSGSIMVFKDA
jgi:YVTN family beta-propeller protein